MSLWVASEERRESLSGWNLLPDSLEVSSDLLRLWEGNMSGEEQLSLSSTAADSLLFKLMSFVTSTTVDWLLRNNFGDICLTLGSVLSLSRKLRRSNLCKRFSIIVLVPAFVSSLPSLPSVSFILILEPLCALSVEALLSCSPLLWREWVRDCLLMPLVYTNVLARTGVLGVRLPLTARLRRSRTRTFCKWRNNTPNWEHSFTKPVAGFSHDATSTVTGMQHGIKWKERTSSIPHIHMEQGNHVWGRPVRSFHLTRNVDSTGHTTNTYSYTHMATLATFKYRVCHT